MLSHRIALAVALAFVATPLAANSPGDATPRQKANGEFLFDHYPPRARAAREEGQVGFRVMLSRDGALESCEVVKSSGYRSLDNETCELIVRYARFKRVKSTDGRSVAVVRDGFVNWRLPRDAPATATARGTRTASLDQEKIICKRYTRTGSLAARTKQCMTRREWSRTATTAQDKAREMIGGKGGAWDTRPEVCGPAGC